MQITVGGIWKDICDIRERSPLIHNITNYVVMNTTANALLSLGASPVMAHAEEEVEQMVDIAQALVINIGTLSAPWVRSMEKAMGRAKVRGIPIIFDPVGNGATGFRTETCRNLLTKVRPTIIRGNGSEIQALDSAEHRTKGVDSTVQAGSAVDAAKRVSKQFECVVCVSGQTDYIVLADRIAQIHNGSPIMPRVTGLGCTATALCGAFAAVNPSSFLACAHAMAVMGIVGEIAEAKAPYPGSFQTAFIDTLYSLHREDIQARLHTGESN